MTLAGPVCWPGGSPSGAFATSRCMHSTRAFGNLWDQHKNLYEGHRDNAAAVDVPIAGLLADLKSRGMLEDTLVMCGSEFGRTPVFEYQNGNEGRLRNGRDHNPHGFTMWFAGGGFRPGYSHGATDDYGYYAVQRQSHRSRPARDRALRPGPGPPEADLSLQRPRLPADRCVWERRAGGVDLISDATNFRS